MAEKKIKEVKENEIPAYKSFRNKRLIFQVLPRTRDIKRAEIEEKLKGVK